MLLFVILAALFAKSFLPDYVHFSNDGPLGQVNAAFGRMPGVLTGVWSDLNDIGTNGGAAAPDITSLLSWILGPIGYSKFFQPLTLFILGIGAWIFFRQLKLSSLAATLGALATALNSSYFGNACWGTASVQIAMGMVFLAMALVMANTGQTPPLVRWSRIALAGLAVGICVMEGADNGAIFSLFVAAFVFFKSLIEDTAPAMRKIGRGVGRVAVIAIFAAFIAAQTITALVETYIVGTAGMGQNKSVENSQEHWDWATQWSLPKTETLGVFVPGLFGYRMDTPKDMMGFLQDHYVGGNYWGGMGRAPDLDRFLDSGKPGPAPSGPQDWWRFGYAGYYCGILVALVAFFAMVQSFRRNQSMFPPFQRRLIWFWTAILVVTLLISWGRFAPFYHFIYILPYFSTIRNPAKFMAIFYLAMIIIFAYGIDGLCRQYFQAQPTAGKPVSWFIQLKNWWSGANGFDRKWTLGSLAAVGLSIFAWLVYWSQKADLVSYLQKVGFPDTHYAEQIASFSIGQVGWFLLFFVAAVILVILAIAGVFSGKRARIGGILLGILLVADLGRADLPWIIHWNYIQKYDIDPHDPTKSTSTNPVINFLRDKPYEHRVSILPFESPQPLRDFDNYFGGDGIYRIEWMQHHFPYYNIQCSDVIQSPRVDSDLAAYDEALLPNGTEQGAYLLLRRWELNNTLYVFGPAGFLNVLNQQLDPHKHRFQIAQRFDIVPKDGVDPNSINELEQLTATSTPDGDLALFKFTGALPRAKLYSHWQVSTNNSETLQTLAAANFDPEKTVLVPAPLPDPPANSSSDNEAGTVDFKSYAPKDIVLDAHAKTPSVLLLNDKYDPNWHVKVDGKPAKLFRANYIMRGVFLPPGAHTVEFKFVVPHKPLYITFTAEGLAIVLLFLLRFATRQQPKTAPSNQRQLIATK
ncbi:MAG: YfhO family protein [Limisphaerales bacterium]